MVEKLLSRTEEELTKWLARGTREESRHSSVSGGFGSSFSSDFFEDHSRGTTTGGSSPDGSRSSGSWSSSGLSDHDDIITGANLPPLDSPSAEVGAQVGGAPGSGSASGGRCFRQLGYGVKPFDLFPKNDESDLADAFMSDEDYLESHVLNEKYLRFKTGSGQRCRVP